MEYNLSGHKRALAGAAILAGGLLGWLSITGMGWLLAAALAGVALFVFVPSASIRAVVAFAFGTILIISSATTFVPVGGTVISVGLRIVGVAFLTLSRLQKSPGTAGFSVEEQLSSARMRSLLPWVIVSYLLYLILSTAFHGQWLNFIFYGGGVILLVIVLIATASVDPYDVVAKGVIAALVFVLAMSVAYGLLVPSIGIAGTRLRGITSNGNTLGFYAFLLGSLALIEVKRAWVKLVLLTLAVVVVLWTSSRASLLALMVVILSVILSKLSKAGILSFFGLIVTVGVVVVLRPRTFDVFGGIIRGNNSRSLSLDTAIEAFRSSPLMGIGMGNNVDEIASSPLRALAFAGIGGLIAVILLWLSFLWFSRKGGIQIIGFSTAAIVHSFFEGWMLSPIGPLLLVFVVCYWVIVRPSLTSAFLTSPSTRYDVVAGRRC